jgi:predicted MPP superfamily phosphohydrolase
MGLSRRAFLGIAAATAGAGLVAADALLVEPDRVTVSRHTLHARSGTAGVRLRLAQLSDLHLRGIGGHEERIAAAVRAERPDLVLFTGDAIDRRDALPLLEEFLQLLGPGLSGFAILGNWEHWAGVAQGALEAVYARAGIELLVNRTAAVARGGGRLLVTGLDDLVGGRPDPAAALAGVTPSAHHLVLAHCPAHRDVVGAEGDASRLLAGDAEDAARRGLFHPLAMLSGHTHGGQVRLGAWAPLRPRGSGRYVSGWYEGDPMPLFVSRGLGTSVVPARLFSPPEIAIFDVTVAAPHA